MRLNLSESVRTWSIRRGETLAISGTRSLTYADLDSTSDRIARNIMISVPKSPVRIAILTEDNIQFVSFLLGIIRSGNIFVLINPTLSCEQINRSLHTIHCDYYISDREWDAITAQYIPVSFGNGNAFEMKTPYPNIGVCDEAGIIFSSGTTGEPKALMRSSFSILSEAIQWMIELQLRIGTSFLIPRPLYYTGGFILMYSSLFSGGRVDLLDDISCQSVLEYIQKVDIDWAFIVPSAIREMIACTGYTRMAKRVLTMGSPIYHSEKIAFCKKYECDIIEVWGNSEGLGTITEPADLYNHPNSIGRPFFTDYLDVEVKGEHGKHGEGILFGISDNEFSEYIGKPELTENVLQGGYIFSEDIGYKDESGYFYLTGRIKDIIVVDGVKVFPADIEEKLIHTNKIFDCAVFSIADDKGNDTVVAAVVMKDDYSARDTIQAVNTIFAPHERIKQYITLDRIPRNHGGKVDRSTIMLQIDKICEVYM